MSESKTTSVLSEPQLELPYMKTARAPRKESSSKHDLNVLSLFSGCGGMDLGFEGDFEVLRSSVNEVLNPSFINDVIDSSFVRLRKTRFKTIFANDILKDARNAWVHYFSKRGLDASHFQTESIVDLVKMYNHGIDVFPNEVDVVTGGFPCQDFSVAGKRNGLNSHKNHKGELNTESTATTETRGQLYMWMKQVVEITKPKIFIAENVKGLVNLANVKEIIQNDFSSAGENGYIVLDPRVLHAANYGVPQSRQRVFFIGIKKSALKSEALRSLSKENIPRAYDPYPSPTHAFNVEGENLKPHVKLSEVFDTVEEPSVSSDISQQYYSKAKFMGKHCQGQIEIKLDGISPTIRAEHHGNIEFRRLSLENGGILKEELEKGLIERRLTPRECALIQTFPPDYDFVIRNENGRKGSFIVSPSKAYKIIGNAVPPLLAFNLASRIEQVWDKYFKE